MNSEIKELEVKLCERNWVVVKLEEELLATNDLIHGKSCCIGELKSRLTQLTGELEMANALAEENKAVATEARQIAQQRKAYAEEKEEEVKLLENSIQELDVTICALESKRQINNKCRGNCWKQSCSKLENNLRIHVEAT